MKTIPDNDPKFKLKPDPKYTPPYIDISTFLLVTARLDIKSSSSSIRVLFSLNMNNKERMCAFIWNVSSLKLLWKGEGSGVGEGEEGMDKDGERKGNYE